MGSFVTLEELKLFHKIDRVAYSRLVKGLGLDSKSSMKILAFWIWVERCGNRNFVYDILPLHDSVLLVLANETLMCIKSLSTDLPILPVVPIDFQPTFMQNFIGNTNFSLRFVYENRDFAKSTMVTFIKNVGARVFSDIVALPPLPQEYLAQTESTQMRYLNLLAQEVCNGPQAQNQSKTQMGNMSILAQEEAKVVTSQNERTLFMTFSKGHPIPKEEITKFLTREFGDCVEAIYMKDIEENIQPLFARVLVKSVADITEILGGQRVAMFSVNGKDVRVRRFVPKQPWPKIRHVG